MQGHPPAESWDLVTKRNGTGSGIWNGLQWDFIWFYGIWIVKIGSYDIQMGWFIICSSDFHRICVGYTVYVYSRSIASVSPAKIRSIGLYMGFDGFGMGCSWYNQQKRRYTMIHQTLIVDFNAKQWNVNRIISIYPSNNCNLFGGFQKLRDTQKWMVSRCFYWKILLK